MVEKLAGEASSLTKVKITIVGEQSVGKSSIVLKFLYDTFNASYEATMAMDFYSKVFYIDKKALQYSIWDTSGQERFKDLMSSYTRESKVVIVIFDLTSWLSFKKCKKWIEMIREGLENKVFAVLVGSKCDIFEERKIPYEKGLKIAEKFEMMYIEVSGKSGYNVMELFKYIGQFFIDEVLE